VFVQACRTLQADDNMIRNINALQVSSLAYNIVIITFITQTLCVLSRAVFRKKLSDSSFDVIDLLVGFDSAECQMRVSLLYIVL